MIRQFVLCISICACLALVAPKANAADWQDSTIEALSPVDDDVARNASRPAFFAGINVSEIRFSENGFDWHIIRFRNVRSPGGPLWVVPHDDENAAFDAMVQAIQKYGGTGIAVNSGPGSARRQVGVGTCGVHAVKVTSCDPNRNFGPQTPLFTRVFTREMQGGYPVIALHTNSPGFAGDGQGGRGDITIWDRRAYAKGQKIARSGGILAVNPTALMDNADTLALTAFLERNRQPSTAATRCGLNMSAAGVHFWHENVGESDGSLSNYLAIYRPEIQYLNAESGAEADLDLAARRHAVMVDAYLKTCLPLGNEPAAIP